MNTTVKRALVGLVFLAVMVGSLLLGRVAFGTVFCVAMLGMMYEFLHIAMGKRHLPVQFAAFGLALLSFVLGMLASGPAGLPVASLSLDLMGLILLMVVIVFDHLDIKDSAYVFTALLYIALPVSLSPFVVMQDGVFDATLMLAFFILIWASDTGAYCFGMLLGQKLWPAKLCPAISPNKSWAGAVGGLAATLLAAFILKRVGWLPFPLVHVLTVAAIMHVLGIFGDLFESLWKRQFGVKDSGNIMPGHGGLLDRFDSSLFAMPAGFVYLILNGLI